MPLRVCVVAYLEGMQETNGELKVFFNSDFIEKEKLIV
jgi:hypothetical protein